MCVPRVAPRDTANPPSPVDGEGLLMVDFRGGSQTAAALGAQQEARRHSMLRRVENWRRRNIILRDLPVPAGGSAAGGGSGPCCPFLSRTRLTSAWGGGVHHKTWPLGDSGGGCTPWKACCPAVICTLPSARKAVSLCLGLQAPYQEARAMRAWVL